MSASQVRTLGVFFGIAMAITVIVVLSLSLNLTARTQDPPPNPTPQALELALRRVGLAPERLAAAGVSANAASSVVVDMHGHLLEHDGPTPYDAAAGQARAECRRLEKLVRSGQATDEDVGACAAARATWEEAQAACHAALDGLFDAATANLSDGQRQLLSTMRANDAWRQPVEFLTLDLAEPERIQLREALANERISAKTGEDPDPDAQVYLATLRADATVAAAISDLDGNQAAVTAAWQQAVEQQ